MRAAKNRTVICSVVFLDVVEYSRMSVSRQARVKGVLNTVVATALQRIPEDERFVLDTGDGAALCFIGDPEDALFVAIDVLADFHDSVTEADETPGLRVGINLGPVRVAEDLSGGMNLIGDGINVAQRIMSFSEPDQILVSRSYYEVVSCLSTRHASLFRYHGMHKDKHIREHVVYEVHLQGRAAEPELLETHPTGPLELGPERLAAVETYLVRVIGPLAAILVPRSMERNATEEAFLQTLATAVPEGPERERFLTTFQKAETSDHLPDGHDGSAEQPSPWSEEDLEHISALLAGQIGPLAKILVSRAAAKSSSLDELVTTLSADIPDEAHRAAFVERSRSFTHGSGA